MNTAIVRIFSNWVPVSASLAVLIISSGSAAQPAPEKPASAVTPASFDRPPREPRETVRFAQRAARVNDEIEQSLALEMRLTTSLRQGSEVIERNQTAVQNRQRRIVTTTEVNDGRAIAALVQYLEAAKQLQVTEDGKPAQNSAEPQPVQSKTYRCRREPGDAGKLVITDAEGHIPPMEEYEIVAQSMAMIGRVNPLVEVLAGRTIAIGETVALPKELAAQVFHLGERFGEVVQFDMTLEKLHAENGLPCAVFLAKVEAASNDSSQMRMQVEGALVVETNTCRAVRINLTGPIAMSESRGTYSTAYQLIGTGQLKMSIASAYRDAPR